MSNFFLTMTPEQWEKLKASPQNFPAVVDFFPSRPEPGDMLLIRQQLRRTPYDTETIVDLGECVIASAEPIAGNIPHRYRLKVTFSMTPEQVKQRYGCPFTPLSDMLRQRKAAKEREKLEKARRMLAHKSRVASKYLSNKGG
ncbi:hypothetical protein NI343_003498 [Salmonella enterica]|nr:hypothetical protein [Salmonella enterica]EJJ4373980.1 hypothetical protein [Salmonella enterica]EKB5296919.1 hypothetical protein [Salmonella enterica]EKC2468870.1 hypothetical protein [Salmonella enterica]EKC2480736.1 hypothetical protein [Salmonella enterica]